MTNLVIIYLQDNNVPAVVIPAPGALEAFAINDIANKDVPFGKKYKILSIDDLPLDSPQESWTVDEEDLTDGIGSKL